MARQGDTSGPLILTTLPPPPDDQGNALLELLAKLHLTMGSIDKRMADQERRRQEQLSYKPQSVDVYADSIYTATWGDNKVPTSGPLVLNFGGPEIGRKWNVRNLSITGGGDPSATQAGQAFFFAGQAIPPGGSLATWVPVRAPTRWIMSTLPNAATFGSNEFPVLYQNNLLAVVIGGTVGNILLGAGLVDDVDAVTPFQAEVF